MKRINKYVCISLFIIILLIPDYAEAARGINVRAISPTGAEVKGEQWLFVIGIDTYIHWPRLKTAVDDAKSIKEILLSHYHFDNEHLIELYDEQATRKKIIGKLRLLAKKVHEDDSLIIFYAGHGHLDSITKEGSWVPVESGTKDASAWITNHDIKNYLKVDVIKAKHILLISDSCFSGDFFRGYRGKLPKITGKVIKRAYQLSSRQAITSGGLEPVSDAGFGKNSVFSYFLIKTLKENQKPFLVPSDMFPDIKAGVAENAKQSPRFGALKDTGGQQGGELVLFLKKELWLSDLSNDTLLGNRELDQLKQTESEAKEEVKKIAAEIAGHEKKVVALNAKIAEMEKKSDSASDATDNRLNTMLDILKHKAEIKRLKEEKRKKRFAALLEDVRKYNKIVSSQFGEDMKAAAWKILAGKYPEAKGLNVGDTETLLIKTSYEFEEIKRDSTFIIYSTGVVTDLKTGLEWYVGPDRETNWHEAKSWVENLTIAGGGWRMPTRKELKTLYQKGVGKRNMTPLLKTTGWYIWSGETKGSSLTWVLNFHIGFEDSYKRRHSSFKRVFAVR